MIRYMIKRAIITSLFWCTSETIVGFLLLILGYREPSGYIRWVNPIGIFLVTYWFFLGAAILYRWLIKEFSWNKWFAGFMSVLAIFILIRIPLILDGNYYDKNDWKIPAFLIFQAVFLVFIDGLVGRWFFRKKE